MHIYVYIYFYCIHQRNVSKYKLKKVTIIRLISYFSIINNFYKYLFTTCHNFVSSHLHTPFYVRLLFVVFIIVSASSILPVCFPHRKMAHISTSYHPTTLWQMIYAHLSSHFVPQIQLHTHIHTCVLRDILIPGDVAGIASSVRLWFTYVFASYVCISA